MRSLRFSSVQYAALGLAAIAAVASACSSAKPKSAPPDESVELAGETGTLGLALTARSSNGTLYRLRQASFEVFRTSSGGVSPPIVVPRPPPSSSPGFPPVNGGPVLIDDDGTIIIGAGGSGGRPSSGPSEPATPPSFAGSGGSGVIIDPPFPFPEPFPDEFFSTTLSSEQDPLATTLEATIPIGQFQITLFDGWFLEKVIDGEAVPVEARLVGPSFQSFGIAANEETTVVYRFETSGEVIEFGQGRLVVRIEVEEKEPLPPNARRGVIETSLDALTGFSLRGTLDAALRNSGASSSGVTSTDVYHAIIDSYSTAALGRDPGAPHCDDESTNGEPSLNGFPLRCPRQESEQFANLDSWTPLAVVSRLDLAPADGANCGQQRMIFGNNSPIGNGRMFIIIEAEVPNPNPECGIDACRPIAELWSSLTNVDSPLERGERLAEAFLTTGVGPFAPFMNSEHLGPDGGQVRTNNFNDFIWTLREFHFQSAPEVIPLPQPVSESPNGELWNDTSPLAQGPACRQSFLEAVTAGALTGDNLSAMAFPVAQACKDAESPNEFFRQDYQSHLLQGSGAFTRQLDEAVAGTGLTALDIANRARFAGSCMGCHQEASGSDLGGGLFAPVQSDFVHVSEQVLEDCGDGTACRGLSNALRDEFIPHRLAVQARLLESASMCGGGGGQGGSGGAGGMAGSGGAAGTAGSGGGSTGGAAGTAGSGGGSTGGAAGTGTAGTGPTPVPPPSTPMPEPLPAPGIAAARLTLGGQLVTPHGH